MTLPSAVARQPDFKRRWRRFGKYTPPRRVSCADLPRQTYRHKKPYSSDRSDRASHSHASSSSWVPKSKPPPRHRRRRVSPIPAQHGPYHGQSESVRTNATLVDEIRRLHSLRCAGGGQPGNCPPQKSTSREFRARLVLGNALALTEPNSRMGTNRASRIQLRD